MFFMCCSIRNTYSSTPTSFEKATNKRRKPKLYSVKFLVLTHSIYQNNTLKCSNYCVHILINIYCTITIQLFLPKPSFYKQWIEIYKIFIELLHNIVVIIRGRRPQYSAIKCRVHNSNNIQLPWRFFVLLLFYSPSTFFVVPTYYPQFDEIIVAFQKIRLHFAHNVVLAAQSS